MFCDLDPESSQPHITEIPNVSEPTEIPNVANQTEYPNDAENRDEHSDGGQESEDRDGHSDGGEESEKSDDSDFDVELEDRIEDVEVDMDDFRKYTDANVEWVGPNVVPTENTQPVEDEVFEDLDLEDFDSGSYPDDVENNRKKALRMLARKHKPVDGNIYSENFIVANFSLTKNYNKKMVAKFHNEDGSQFGPNGPSGSSGKSKMEKTKKVDSQSQSTTNKDKAGKPKVNVKDFQSCPWALHCSKAKNEESWFKINPCNGPDMWKKSPSPITLTPPDYHTPVGRPPKKRKKSAAELYDGMVKKGKLSRAGKSVLQTNVPSRQLVNQSQASQASVNPSTPTANQSQTFVRPTPSLIPTKPSVMNTAPFLSPTAPFVTASPSAPSLRPTTPFVTPRFTKNTTSRLSPIKKVAAKRGKGKNVKK
ncbi:hypothetical protein Tco_1058038 [Tanacetum coccineum]|uniref:Uncharacterized protein n=1 Tax=Tanacetum coccineum TaxID=301880 RepID=A0ABQ5H809_9ASTR